jgi:phosphate starvation-inducible PhoH-like protein
VPSESAERVHVRVVTIDDVDLIRFVGPHDTRIRELEAAHPNVSFHLRNNVLTLTSDHEADLERAELVVTKLLEVEHNGADISRADIREVTRMVRAGFGETAATILTEPILTARGKTIRAQTQGQRAYVDAIDENTIVFGIGPAGTGKTYLAMAKAVQALQRREVSRIILTRPAVEAGERLGYLPGSLEEKIDPYLRPLFDAVSEMLDADTLPKLLSNGTIEVAPLAYMRGRTLNDSFVILDEAQNTTPEQMKMFLTRLGFGSRMVITGDITQVDVPLGASGLRSVTRVLDDVDDIFFAKLTSDDVVRHSLVGRIVDAYTAFDEQRMAEQSERASHKKRDTNAELAGE